MPRTRQSQGGSRLSRAALAALRAHHGTFAQAATLFLAELTEAAGQTGEIPDDLRIFVATGAAVPRGLAEQATRTLGAAVCGAWGTTETCLGSLAAPADEPAMVWGTDGRALHDVKLRITDDEGNVLAPGQEGNFEVHSPTLFEGYLDRPDETAAAMIEQLLHTHPLVSEIAIVAMPDERLGERACAFAVAAPGFDFTAMQRFLDDQHVAKQYWPERLEIIGAMPRNPVGKIKKFVLRDQARALTEE
ncbi:MAG TPA: AMP-binding protein [Streptosporangiaceae bacterium]|nr:AMP-binding protein [Streptosporangiaceae bacterium]